MKKDEMAEILNKLASELLNKDISEKISKISKELNERKHLILDLDELESLVSEEKVEYEDYIGDISIDEI